MDTSSKWLAGWGFIVAGVVSALVFGLMLRFGAREHTLQLLEWLDSFGLWAPVMFILLEIAVVLFFVPGILFTMGAGFLFGPLLGTVCVVTGHTVGGVLAFLIARTCFGSRPATFLRSHPRLRNLETFLSEGGWKIILLTRLLPFFPFKLSNYCFGLMRFRVRDFLIGTSIGTLPIAATNVYAGSLAADLATIGVGAERTPLQWAFWIFGLVMLLVTMLLLGKFAQNRLATYKEGRSG